MFDDLKHLVNVSELGEVIYVEAGIYNDGPFSERLLVFVDGRIALYQTARSIIWDCDERSLHSSRQKMRVMP